MARLTNKQRFAERQISMASEEDITLAKAIRQFFYQKQKEISKNYVLLKRFDKPEYWLKTVEICKHNNLDYKLFIEEMTNKWKTTITPPMLCGMYASKKAIAMAYEKKLRKELFKESMDNGSFSENGGGGGYDSYEDAVKAYVDFQISNYVETKKSLYKNCKNKKRIIDKFIKLKGFAFPAWLRLLICPDDTEMKKIYKNEANQELLNIPGLKKELENRGYNLKLLFD